MCWGTFGVSLILVTLLVCFNKTFCARLNTAKDSALVDSSDKISIVEFIAANRTSFKNDTALEIRQRPKGSVAGATVESGKNLIEESRKKKNQNQKGFMERILPMMIIPFMVSTSMIPMMLISLKIMILKSAVIGKIGILLMLLNMFRRRANGQGGVFTHNISADEVAMEHYGYQGGEEYGAYINRRKKRRISFV